MQKRIGLVFSGGGARGIAHLGVLQAMEDVGLRPNIISGTSAGAVAAALYAAGHSVPVILDIVRRGSFFDIGNVLLNRQGLFSMHGFEELYAQYFGNSEFSSLEIPVYVAATDLMRGTVEYFHSGPIAQALLASSCIPLVYQPVKHKNTYYVDGGILDNFPIHPLLGKCDAIIGSHVNSIRLERDELTINEILDRSMHLALGQNLSDKVGKCSLYIEPPDMSRFSVFDVRKIDEIFEAGYTYAKNFTAEMQGLKS